MENEKSQKEKKPLVKFEIKKWLESKIIFTHSAEENSIKLTLETGVAAKVDFYRADLTGADLTGAYLTGAYLRGAYLTGAYLRGADLTGADLRGAYLTGADLTGADLRGAYLTGAYLRGADLTGAYLRGAYLRGADLTGADLMGAYLTGADLRGAKYKDIEITKTPIQILNLYYSVLIFENHMQIGCEFHTHKEWDKFDNRRIIEMDGKAAAEFWKEHKDLLMGFCKFMAKPEKKKDE
jgi:hypothetical protein